MEWCKKLEGATNSRELLSTPTVTPAPVHLGHFEVVPSWILDSGTKLVILNCCAGKHILNVLHLAG